MNAHAESSAVAGNSVYRVTGKTRKSRARFAYLFDMADPKEREVCRRVTYFSRGGDYTCFEFRRTTGTDGQRILWALVDTVPRWRIDGRYSVHWWNIDAGTFGWDERRTLGRAMALLNHLTLH